MRNLISEMLTIAGTLSEAGIEVDSSFWKNSTGKSAPKGDGTWMFAIDRSKRDYDNKNNWFSFNGSYGDAKKAAAAWAKTVDPKLFRIYLAESAVEKGLDKAKPIVISGLKGVNSKQATKKFKNFAAYEKWHDKEDSEAGDWTIQHVYNESAADAHLPFDGELTEGKYFSVLLPPAKTGDAKNATKWHAPQKTTRGAFDTEAAAHAWAKKNTPGADYTVVHFTIEESVDEAVDLSKLKTGDKVKHPNYIGTGAVKVDKEGVHITWSDGDESYPSPGAGMLRQMKIVESAATPKGGSLNEEAPAQTLGELRASAKPRLLQECGPMMASEYAPASFEDKLRSAIAQIRYAVTDEAMKGVGDDGRRMKRLDYSKDENPWEAIERMISENITVDGVKQLVPMAKDIVNKYLE